MNYSQYYVAVVAVLVMLSLVISIFDNYGVKGQQPQLFCDPSDLVCQQRQQQIAAQIQTAPMRAPDGSCIYQDIWLLPGHADDACTRRKPTTETKESPISIDPGRVTIRPAVIKFPGCFSIEIPNVHINEAPGCGGFGNNCYYCGICESLEGIQGGTQNDDSSAAGGLPAEISQQLRGLNCPRTPGTYSFRKRFCFNSWEMFDKDKNCRLDFLESSERQQTELKSALLSLQQIGYGTVLANVRLAFNASAEINKKAQTKLAKIEAAALAELEGQRKAQSMNDEQFEALKRRVVEERQNAWHRNNYLPWLLSENEFACFRITFNVCERPPRRRPDGLGYICE